MSNEWLLGIVDVDLNKAMVAFKLRPGFNADDVRAAYKRRVLETKCHPDQGGDPELFKRLTTARDLLIKSFDVKFTNSFGTKRKQGPMGVRTRNHQQGFIDKVLEQIRMSSTIEEALERVEALRG